MSLFVRRFHSHASLKTKGAVPPCSRDPAVPKREHNGDTSDTMSEFEVNQQPSSSVNKNRKGKPIKSGQKEIIYNVYTQCSKEETISKTQCVKRVSRMTGVGERMVWQIIKEKETNNVLKSPPRKRIRVNCYQKLDEYQKKQIRQIVHNFFLQRNPPTLDQIYVAVSEDETIPPLSRTTLHRVLKKLGFEYEGLSQVTPECWARCVGHVLKQEEDMYKLDILVEEMSELNFTVNTGSSDEWDSGWEHFDTSTELDC